MNNLNYIDNFYNLAAGIGAMNAYPCLITKTCKEVDMTLNTLKPRHHNFQDLTGQKFGRLTPYEYFGVVGSSPSWWCRCDCGKDNFIVRGYAMKSGVSASCGCLRRERILASITTHGHSGRFYKTPEYRAWAGMISRCTQTSGKTFRIYGGRGIMVCERWRNSYENFLEDMGRKPSADYSLDRIDSNGNYEPGNCRWATRVVQNRNTRRNRLLTFKGETLTLAEWAKRVGIKYNTLFGRWQKGLPVEQILSKEKFKTGSTRINTW